MAWPLHHRALQGVVDAWWCPLVPTTGNVARASMWLSAGETARAERFGDPALRERYIIGRATLRMILSNALGMAPRAVNIVRGRRGRPALADPAPLDFNVSHTADVAVFAFTREPALRIGVDVETAARTPRVALLARKLLTPEERTVMAELEPEAQRTRFLRTWTCKEAMSKATGDGLAAPFGRIMVDPDDPPRMLGGPPPYDTSRWTLYRIAGPRECIITVALHRTM